LFVYSLSALLVATGPVRAQETSQQWYDDGRAAVERNLARLGGRTLPRARNVILFVGDGMGISTVTAARILAGQLAGGTGEENELYFELFPDVALSKTYNVNAQTPDSAGTMSAIATGIKTDAGLISVGADTTRGDCDSQQGRQLTTLLELAEQSGMATGIVTTARITHATPAANYAHVMDRDFEDDRDGANLANPGDCADIARQLVEFKANHPGSDGIEVAMCGGRRSFLPRVPGVDPEDGGQGERMDGRNLIEEWLADHHDSQYVWNKQQFDELDIDATRQVLGLFDMSHMEYELDRPSDTGGEPSLSEMTATAIRLLDKNPNGFYLNVEAGRIDHAHHATNPQRALLDTIELANAVRLAHEMTDPAETLIIVTADHSHVFTLAGYPARGNPILGKVVSIDAAGETLDEPALAADGLPYTTLGYANGAGFHFLPGAGSADAIYNEDINGGRADLTTVDTTHEGFHPEVLVPMEDETHGGEDVAVYATGPGSELVRGVLEQNVIFHIMHEALQLDRR
jgi:alkaline phosphatase